MSDLNVFELYENASGSQVESFAKGIRSSLTMSTEIKKVEEDLEWIEMFEEVIPHIEDILKNPNRFIVDEEEIVKIELARRTTVESIKHLAKHTSFIQSIDDDTGEVTPSKILNINKEEDYDTYENRVIYTLIENMKFYVHTRKEAILSRKDFKNKNSKEVSYTGTTRVNNENVSLNINLATNLDGSVDSSSNNIFKKIEKIEEDILILTQMEVYRDLHRKRISLVTPPIRRTNRILKNPHFQYAMKLWTYMQDNMDDKTSMLDDKDEIKDHEELKRFLDETFLLDYLSLMKVEEDAEEISTEDKKKKKMMNTEQLIEKLVFVNSGLTEQEIKDLITEKYEVIKYKNRVSLDGIQKIFRDSLDKVFRTIEL